jgi:uncharacterized protein with ParB-like and HNH nuclease domain
MENNKLTPATIGEHRFTIPLYQRLFEWEEDQVNQLLSDLYQSYIENEEQPYYIGVLTVFKDKSQNRFSLVDGQQRFTVLMLMGIVMGWENFLLINGELRLKFFARKNDEEYLQSKVNNKDKVESYTNEKMEAAIITIKSFLEKNVENGRLEPFKDYIKKQTAFFISRLPVSYTATELNRYFEAMNEAGKGLENHEILKVELLQELKKNVTLQSEEIDQCTKIWNAVSQMDKCLIRKEENESTRNYKNKYIHAFSNSKSILDKIEVNGQNGNTIKEIESSNNKPQSKDRNRDEGSILDFQEFLLLVLGLTLKNNTGFDKNKLLKNFEELENNKDLIKPFFENLLKYRLLFDYFIIRTTSKDGRTTTYTLNYSDDTEQIKPNETHQSKQALKHYQSMLYVSASYHIWLTPIMQQLENFFIDKTGDNFEFLKFLKEWDNSRHSGEIDLKYGSINRYWFWRLDYYLWERREEFFKDKVKEIVNHYVFRPNRSIEHIAPQTPKGESKIILNDKMLHEFGNLAMISSGQNSSLQNEHYQIKKMKVAEYVDFSKGRSIESLKLLKIYEFNAWSEDNIKTHHNDMIDVLVNSFYDDSMKQKLMKLKFSPDAK